MVNNKSSLFGIIALIIGASGLGFGVFSVVNFQVVKGPQGLPGQDGQDGQDGIDGEDGKDAPGDIVVGILDPDEGEVISGNVTIKTLIAGSDNYTISILKNSIEIGTTTPMVWDTTVELNGWYNLTVIATDLDANSKNQDQVIVYVNNAANLYPITEPMGRIIVIHNGTQHDITIPWNRSYISSHIGQTHIWKDLGPKLKEDSYCNRGSHPHCYFEGTELGIYIVIFSLSDRIELKWSGIEVELLDQFDVEIDYGYGEVYATIIFLGGAWRAMSMGGTVGVTNFWCSS